MSLSHHFCHACCAGSRRFHCHRESWPPLANPSSHFWSRWFPSCPGTYFSPSSSCTGSCVYPEESGTNQWWAVAWTEYCYHGLLPWVKTTGCSTRPRLSSVGASGTVWLGLNCIPLPWRWPCKCEQGCPWCQIQSGSAGVCRHPVGWGIVFTLSVCIRVHRRRR